CAAFLAGSIARPLRRIRAVVNQIVARGDVERLGRIPIFHRDELGELAQGVNEMIDRLQASAERIRRYGADREQALAVAARRAAELDAVLDNMIEGVFACDKTGAVTHMNAAGLRLLELSSAGAVSRAPMEAARGGARAEDAGGDSQGLRPHADAHRPDAPRPIAKNAGGHRPRGRAHQRRCRGPARYLAGSPRHAAPFAGPGGPRRARARDGGWRGRLGAPPRGDPTRGPRTVDGPRRQRTYPAGSRQPPEQCAQVLA